MGRKIHPERGWCQLLDGVLDCIQGEKELQVRRWLGKRKERKEGRRGGGEGGRKEKRVCKSSAAQ